MTDTTDQTPPTSNLAILQLTAGIVAAHIGHNDTTADAVPALIRSVYAALEEANTVMPAAPVNTVPAVPIRRSVFPDYIVCLEDGRKLKMLKRHLQAAYGLTPDDYRRKWGLPSDYPVVAPNYAAKRATLARSAGLGSRINSRATDDAPVIADSVEGVPVMKIPARRRGRPTKAA